jgi:hypothetical protein
VHTSHIELIYSLSESGELPISVSDLRSKGTRAKFRLTSKRTLRLVLAAATLHVIIVLGVFLTGRAGILPNTFDEYGIGASFAIDSRSYRLEAEELADFLRQGRMSEWHANPRLHVKLYSLCFAALDRLLGPNILSAEPLNLICYLLVLAMVYAVAREVFDQRVGLIAAGVVAVWPSFLLHTTQMLRDPMFIFAMLLLVWALVISVNKALSPLRGLGVGLAGAVACFFLWLIRGDWWELIVVVLVAGVGVSLLRHFLDWKFRPGNLLAAVLIVAAGVAIPRTVSTYRQSESYLTQAKETNAISVAQRSGTEESVVSTLKEGENSSLLVRAPKRIGRLRHLFIIRYPLAGSNIDTDVELNSLTDIIQYLPRAIMVGLFSPFPNMWFSTGAQVGREGRLLSGAETLIMYLIQCLAMVSVLLNRRRLVGWLLASTIVIGVTGLAYVVVNISALYRMRYVFWILTIILAAKVLDEICGRWLAQRKARSSTAIM